MLISEAFKLYRTDCIITANCSLKTDEAYANTQKLLIDYLGDIPFNELTHEDVIRWKQHLLTWQKPDTMRGNVMSLRMVLKYVEARGHKVLRWDSINVPKRTKREVQFLTDDEVDEFILVLGRPARGYKRVSRLRNVAIAMVLANSGIRVSELCRLDRRSIRNNEFVVIGKSRDPRPCYVTDETLAAINEYLAERTDNNPALFISHQGSDKRINTKGVRRVFDAGCKSSRFENVHPHTLRHSFATSMINRRVDILYVSRMMGHTNLETTRMYTHFTDPQLKEIYMAARQG